MNGDVIWTSGKRIVAVFDSLRNNIKREAGYRINYQVNTPYRAGGELFSKSYCSFYVAKKLWADWEGYFSRFSLRDLVMIHMRIGLHLCELRSTICVHFCSLEFLTLWCIRALISCICGSEGMRIGEPLFQ